MKIKSLKECEKDHLKIVLEQTRWDLAKKFPAVENIFAAAQIQNHYSRA